MIPEKKAEPGAYGIEGGRTNVEGDEQTSEDPSDVDLDALLEQLDDTQTQSLLKLLNIC